MTEKRGRPMGLPRFFSLQTPVVDAAAGFLIQQAAQQGNGALLAANSDQMLDG